MTTPVLDDFLLRLAPAPPLPVLGELVHARESLRQSQATLHDVADAALESMWRWRDSELDVRYGFYRQYESLEHTRGVVRQMLADTRWEETPGRPLVAAASSARWDLHGLLCGVDDSELDCDPGKGEWTLRQTLAHIVGGQRGYGWFTAWWLAQRATSEDEVPAQMPDDAEIGFPDEETEARGTLSEIQRRLDAIVDLSAGVFAPLGDTDLAIRARWSGTPVDVRFRVVRWSSHLREHTIQLAKTLVFIGHPITEVDRLQRLISSAYGRLEEEVFMLPDDSGRTSEALELVESVTYELPALSQSIVEAARQES